MNKRNGFTLIELMIAVAIIGIVAAMIARGGAGLFGGSNVSWGINGMVEQRCLNGYLFVVGEGGQTRQVLDEFGKGAKCEKGGS